MTFTGSGTTMIPNTAGAISSTNMLNGQLYVVQNGGSLDKSFSAIRFAEDSANLYTTGGMYQYNGGVSQRSTGTFNLLNTSPSIVNNTVNDVAAAVMCTGNSAQPSADTLSGRCLTPQQFVGVATGGGITLINETNQTSANSSDTATFTSIAMTYNSGSATYNSSMYGAKASSTINVYTNLSALATLFATTATYSTSVNPAPAATAVAISSLTVTAGTSTVDAKSNTIYVGTTAGVGVIQENQAAFTSGSVKYYTNSRITEEMVGDIRLMAPMNGSGTPTANTTISGFDASIKANAFTTKGTGTIPSYATGVRGTGMSFSGAQYLCTGTTGTCADNSNLAITGTTISVGAWVYPTSTSATQMILNKFIGGGPGGWFLRQGSGMTVEWETSPTTPDDLTSTGTMNINQWNHIVAVMNGANKYIYINGILAGSNANGAALGASGQTATIGAWQASGTFSQYFNGKIDEPFVTATALSASQVKHMYNVGSRALQSHSASLGGAGADTNQQLGGTSAVIGDARPDYNNQFMYVGTNDATNGRVSKINLNSDTNIKTFDKTANTPTGGTLLANDDTNTLAVSYNLEAVGSATTGVKSMSPDNNSNNLAGSLFSKTQTLASSTKFAYLWTSVNVDSQDASSAINVYACNAYSTKALCDSNNAWVLGTLAMTDSTQALPEREYTFTFPTAGSNMTFKFDFSRGSTKTNTYISRYGATWSSSVGGNDIAERYTSNEPAYPGDILVMDTPPVGGDAAVSLARTPYDTKILGVVTTNPGIVMDNNLVDLNFNAASRNSPDHPAVALAGRIPVNVSTKNGPILISDGITASEIPGVGEKSLQAGQIVAKALNTFSCSSDGAIKEADGTCQGQVMALLNITYFEPKLEFADMSGFNIVPDITSTDSGNLASAAASTAFKIVRITTDGASEVVDQMGTFANVVAGNIKTGVITTKDFVADNVIAKVIHTDIISPLPGNTNVTVQIGSTATPSGQFVIQNATGSAVATIDNLGNATFSGQLTADSVHANKIYADQIIGGTYAQATDLGALQQIKNLLTQVQTDQSVLLAATASADLNATGSANIAQVITNDLFVTGQAAINSLSVTNSLTLGSDLVLNGQDSSLNTLSSPLKLQSLAMAPVEIMGGLVTIDTKGNMQIAGNLAVEGRISSSGLTLKDSLQGQSLQGGDATSSASLLSLQDQSGTQVGSVNASGSAQFNSISTPQFIIAAPDATSAGTIINGTITTNSTVGQAVIPAGVSEITIKNPKVTDYTLVYVTPTSSTQNNVLYVKSKSAGQFVVGFTTAINTDVNFNWWIVQVQN